MAAPSGSSLTPATAGPTSSRYPPPSATWSAKPRITPAMSLSRSQRETWITTGSSDRGLRVPVDAVIGGVQLAADKPLPERAAVVAIDRMDRGQHVPLDRVALEHIQAPHHPVEGGLAALVDPVGVVHLPRAVDRDPDQELVVLQERTPFVIQQG